MLSFQSYKLLLNCIVHCCTSFLMSRKCEWRENFFNFHLSVVQIRDGSRVTEPTKKASWPNKWNVHIKLQKKKIAHGLDDPSDGLHDPPLERITDCNAAFKLFILCHNVSDSLRCSWPMHCLNHLYSPSTNYCTKACSDIQQSHKDIREHFWWAVFLPVSWLAQLLRVPDGWVQWHVKIHRGDLARGVYSKQWKGSSNMKAFFKREQFLQGQNLPTGFPAFSNHWRCTAAYSATQPTILVSKQIGKLWYSWTKKTTHMYLATIKSLRL